MSTVDLLFAVWTLAQRGMAAPGRPDRIAGQLNALRRYGFGLGGELRASAARYPDRPAIIDDQRMLTYRQLLDRAQRTAVALRDGRPAGPSGSADVQSGQRIAVLGRNHTGLVEAMLAASMLGIDLVMINTGLSGRQIAAVLAEQRVDLLLHDAEFADLVADLPASVVRWDGTRLADLVERTPTGELEPPARTGRVVMLTSGTTGAPRGARRPTPHGIAPLAAILSRIPLNAGDRMLIAPPLCHTWGYAAVQLCLALSGTMVLHRRFDPQWTLETLDRERCRVLFAVPVMLSRMLEVEHPRPTALAVTATSGSALPGQLATRFMDRFGEVLYNLYGSTETSWVSIATPADLRRAPDSAGRPPRGTRVRLLDTTGTPVPAGHTGQIFVANDMLFEGYTDGAGKESSGGLLGTGDVGHVDPDGLLFVDGRADDMIISGAENVFPAQLEDALAALPQVREVAVFGVADPEFGQRLAAWLVLRPGARLTAEEVRAHAHDRLARFYVPRDVHFLTELPRNATGKVVPRLLPGRDQPR